MAAGDAGIIKMKHLFLRCFWWINYITKFAYLLLAVTIACAMVCVLVGRIFKKKLSFLYAVIFIAALIPMFIVGIRMGIDTFDILVFSHPVITVIAASGLKVLFGGIIWVMGMAKNE